MIKLFTDDEYLKAKSKDLLPFQCENCGNKFYGEKKKYTAYYVNSEQNFGKLKFCSRKCSSDNKKKRIITQCHQCGKKVERISSKSKSGYFFCSHNCSAIYSNQHRIRIKKDTRFNKSIRYYGETICPQCHCIFQKKKEKQFLCSRKCSVLFSLPNLLRSAHEKTNHSEATKKSYINGKKVYGGKTKWLIYKDYKVQGTFELRTCHILDKWKKLEKIKDWEYTNDRFEYIGFDSLSHRYLLDFKIWNNDNTFYYLEVKGYTKTIDFLKWEAVMNAGYYLQVWFLEHIQKYENMVPEERFELSEDFHLI